MSPKFEIKHRYSGAVLYSLETESIKLCLEAAAKSGADLGGAYLRGAYLREADLRGAYLREAYLGGAYLRGAYLGEAYLREAYLGGAYLGEANLREADLRGADLGGAYLGGAYLRGADLREAKNQMKIMGVEPGNVYWKRFDIGLNNNGYQFHVGLNALRDGEIFNGDERVLCGYPGFHFASRSWCAAYYPQRPLEARIRIPLDAKICEPWATDGQASADRIEILQVYDVATGEDVTEKYR
jgi:hypothetical protein